MLPCAKSVWADSIPREPHEMCGRDRLVRASTLADFSASLRWTRRFFRCCVETRRSLPAASFSSLRFCVACPRALTGISASLCFVLVRDRLMITYTTNKTPLKLAKDFVARARVQMPATSVWLRRKREHARKRLEWEACQHSFLCLSFTYARTMGPKYFLILSIGRSMSICESAASSSCDPTAPSPSLSPPPLSPSLLARYI